MDLIHPSIEDKFTSLEEDVFSTNLRIAVWLIADDSKKEPLGCIKVRIKKVNKEAVKNLSGYYIFNNPVAGENYVEVESDLYDPIGVNINTYTLDPKYPVVGFILKLKFPK
jgi:hypothetical protein